MFTTLSRIRQAGLLLAGWLWCQWAAAQAPAILWDRSFGGSDFENMTGALRTPDGGYLLSGPSGSGASGNKTLAQPGFWVVKLTADGNKAWERIHNFGTGNQPTLLRLTADGGYVLGGTSGSTALPNYWIAKLDAAGNQQWARSLGGSGTDHLSEVQQTADGGFLLGGFSNSGISGDKTSACRGEYDYWVVRLNANGTTLWDRTLGGTEYDESTCLSPTPDGGCVVGGFSVSGISGDKSEAIRGSVDYWVVKLDATGRPQWDRTYGGDITDILTNVLPTPDGGYVLGGFSGSNRSGDRSQPCRGGDDFWVVKLNSLGQKEWDSSFGSNGQDDLRTMSLTPDGGYLLSGESSSSASFEKSQPSRGFFDYWVVKTDGRGRLQWERTLGTPEGDQASGVLQAPDGTYFVAGTSNGSPSGERTAPLWGSSDFWALKLAAARPTRSRVEIRGDSLLCSSQPLLLTAATSAPAAAYRWSTGATTPSITVTQLGTYTVTATFPDGQTSTDQQVVAPFVPDLRIDGDTLLCAGSTARLTAVSPSATSYLWSTGDSASAITIRQPGTYHVTAFYGVACSATQRLVVRTPKVTIDGGPQVCSGASTDLTANAPGAAQLRWNTGATTATLRVTQPGTYSVVASFAGGCMATATTTITTPAGGIRITGDSVLCAGRPVRLTAQTPGATAYRWSTGATTASIEVAQTGTYSVVATYAGGCTDQARQVVRPAPDFTGFSLGPDTTLCENQVLQLRVPANLPAGSQYQWSDGSRNLTLEVRLPGLYSLRLSTLCGPLTVSRRIAVTACAPPANIITPNGDRFNERWVLQGLPAGPYSLELYNRWGRKVYEAAEYRNDWGYGAEPGTYYYLLRHLNSGQLYKGWLTVRQ